jgi:hypothetical protein
LACATARLIYDVATRHWLGLLAVAGVYAGFGWLARHAARQRCELEAWREELQRLRRGARGGDRGRRREDKAIPLGHARRRNLSS